jgi:hypothetical protein
VTQRLQPCPPARIAVAPTASILQLWCLYCPIIGWFGWHHNCKIDAMIGAGNRECCGIVRDLTKHY